MKPVEKFNHPDLAGGIVWADCELDFIHKRDAEWSAKVAELERERDELDAKLQQSNIVSQLVDAWCREHGAQMPWGNLIELVAVIEKMPKEESDRLLCLDYPDYPEKLVKAEGQLRVAREALSLASPEVMAYASDAKIADFMELVAKLEDK